MSKPTVHMTAAELLRAKLRYRSTPPTTGTEDPIEIARIKLERAVLNEVREARGTGNFTRLNIAIDALLGFEAEHGRRP